MNVDERGRLYLPKKVRERHGERYRIVDLGDCVKLVPVHEDSVEGLKEALDGLPNVPFEEFDAVTDQRGRREARDSFL